MILYYSNGITHFTYLKSLDRIYFFIKLMAFNKSLYFTKWRIKEKIVRVRLNPFFGRNMISVGL